MLNVGTRSRKYLMLGLAVVLMFATLPAPIVLAATNAQAHDTTIPYDPSKCSTDPHEMVYFAVGRRVYRQPMENIFYIQGYTQKMREDQHIPQPPKPSEPAGCPDHPIQALGFYLKCFSAMPGDKDKILYANADRVPIEIINNPKHGLQNEGLLDLICNRYDLRDTSVPGFTGCKKPFQCDHGAVYEANDYALPFDQKMILDCVMPLQYCEDSPGICEVSYKMYDDLNVWYKFKTKDVSIQQALDYDRELRRRIEAAEIKNYRWPEQ
jgi:hypothetical protein